ncbi:hypothetical protein [Mucilaginibacter sp. L3T2-6]|uniref:hypothetical protein n=1 Tax=Mucilaginibacter sp. L3T2-6 TaxID=3062491 RepID=UPI002676A3E0|nr:hypothetical protein [Mucilaginibacter sp. L3T2-6]MDO3641875.1 hypothetical protein [Mucilaginibacter sp. L3T2-6]MDV6214447.1 hypothetical protein [Mucilaginibacter sp. L3T2-6]
MKEKRFGVGYSNSLFDIISLNLRQWSLDKLLSDKKYRTSNFEEKNTSVLDIRNSLFDIISLSPPNRETSPLSANCSSASLPLAGERVAGRSNGGMSPFP